MRNLFTTLFFVAMSIASFGQGAIIGKILDAELGEALIGASVLVEGTTTGTVTDFDGMFTISDMDAGEYTLLISYTGYTDMQKKATVTTGVTDIGTLELGSGVTLSSIEVIADVAVDRRTPVAVSTLDGAKIEALVGNQEYPEILKSTPSIYVTKQGGGFGDARINVRGFDQRNTAVMINGIPVNDMENGRVFWSNWAGLSDVTSKLQVQRGLGASKLAVPSLGGSINVITNAAEMEKGAKVGLSIGNDGYTKYNLVLSSGQMENGWAFTAQATHTRGDGYVDGTMFRAWSYFFSTSKTFNNKHSVAFTVVGTPQWHHQRNASGRFDNVTLQTFEEKGIKYNHLWGMKDGKEFNWRKNFYHKPKAFVNHYWNISDKTDLKSSAYVSLGRGGGTGPRGLINTDDGSRIFDSYGSDGTGTHDANGQVRFDDIVAYNQGQTIDGWGTKEAETDGEFAGQHTTSTDGSGFIRRASINSHNWFGILSTLTHRLKEDWTLIAGIDGRYYKGIHYRRVENLMGNDAYLSRSDDNNPQNYITEEATAEFGNFADDSYKESNNVIAYWNDGEVFWAGLFAQLEYTNDKLSWFTSISGTNQSFKRIDYFGYLDSDEKRETPWVSSLGGTIKTGANYNINDNHNVFLNTGIASRQPIFDDYFPAFTNDIAFGVENQNVKALELGYGYTSEYFDIKFNLYSTTWDNRRLQRSLDVVVDTVVQEGTAVFTNVGQQHNGLEFEVQVRPIKYITVDAMVSLGSWEFTDDFNAEIFDENQQSIGTATLFANGIKIGDAAQTTANIGLNIYPIKGLSIYTDIFYFDRLYADFNITEEQFLSEGGQVVELPSYTLMDAGISYTHKFSFGDVTFTFNANNVLDEKYVSELETNILDDSTTEENEFLNNKGFYGFGRTWNTGLKFKF